MKLSIKSTILAVYGFCFISGCGNQFGAGFSSVVKASAIAQKQVTAMGDYTTQSAGTLKFSLFTYTDSIQLVADFNQADNEKSQLNTIWLSLADYKRLFEDSTQAKVETQRSNFYSKMRSEFSGNKRTVTILSYYRDNPSDVTAFEATLTLEIEGKDIVNMNLVYKVRQAVLGTPLPNLSTAFEGSSQLTRTQPGLGSYGDNSGIKLGRLLSTANIEKALSTRPLNDAALAQLCEFDCPGRN